MYTLPLGTTNLDITLDVQLMEKLYTISEVADKLGLAAKTLRRWEETGKFVGNRTLGGQRRYTLTDVQILDAIKHGTIPDSRDLLTLEQAAQLFGVSTVTVTRWEEEGKIHPLITAGITYYPRHRLLAKMEELKKQMAYDAPTFESVSIPPRPLYSPPPLYAPPPVPDSIQQELAPLPAVQPPDLKPQTRQSHRQPLSPLVAAPRVPSIYSTVPINILITAGMILVYHLIFSQPHPAPVTSQVNQGSVQGVTTPDTTHSALDNIIDKSGNLKPPSISTRNLSLTPASAPANASPGTLYFDAGSQSLKLYTTVWTDLTSGRESNLQGTTVISGHNIVPKDKNTVKIDSGYITAVSQISVTFTADYAPAKKYWITKGLGTFSVQTDFPVSANAPFDYVILNTAAVPEATPAPSAASTTPSLVNSVIR